MNKRMNLRVLFLSVLSITLVFPIFSFSTVNLSIPSKTNFSENLFSEYVPGEFLVQIKSEFVHPSPPMSNSLLVKMSQILKGEVRWVNNEIGLLHLTRSIVENPQYIIKSLQNEKEVEFIEPNYIYKISKIPNDPELLKLWGLKNVGQADSDEREGTQGIDISLEKSWEITTGSKDVIVAVVDTGVDYYHPDLQKNMWVNQAEKEGKEGVDDDENGIIDDIYGANYTEKSVKGNPLDDNDHGTHCSGTIGAIGDNGVGVVGVNWNVSIMAVKFIDASGSGTLENGIKAIDYAVKMKAKIINASWGGGGFSEALKKSIERAGNEGVLFVAAAGNDLSDNDVRAMYPASYDLPNIVSVAAIDNRGKLAYFSNYGEKTVHVAAPGVNIYSTLPNSKYGYLSGTSMATPHVSGISALLLANEPLLSVQDIKNRLIETSFNFSSLHKKTVSNGFVSAYNALSNIVHPPHASDPSFWNFISTEVSSPHPYMKNQSYVYEVRVPNAKKISIFFNKMEVERGYDKVIIYDSTDKVVEILTGINDSYFTSNINGSYAKIVFNTDASIEKYGFDITKIAFQSEDSTHPEQKHQISWY